MELQEEAEIEGVDPYEDDQFFESYESFALQRTMLSDKARNVAYKESIRGSVEGKVVLDVGCGTGFLSILCDRYGATRVYGCEASEMAWPTDSGLMPCFSAAATASVARSLLLLKISLPSSSREASSGRVVPGVKPMRWC